MIYNSWILDPGLAMSSPSETMAEHILTVETARLPNILQNDAKRHISLGGTICLTLLVGLVCFIRVSSCQALPQSATTFATFEEHLR